MRNVICIVAPDGGDKMKNSFFTTMFIVGIGFAAMVLAPAGAKAACDGGDDACYGSAPGTPCLASGNQAGECVQSSEFVCECATLPPPISIQSITKEPQADSSNHSVNQSEE
jgi:hypothetical protein